ncbi:nuclear transport factor 2 family protein [Niallia sp. 01092]|uniref:nuclear transport factor 2 family protein n=1 Tax=unclassified Niallia TaxID=2837522 RepID=UPI003FCF868C
MTEAATTVKSFFEALWSKDTEKALQLVDENAIFIAMRKESSDQVPLYGTFKGKEGVKKFLATLATSFDTQHFQINHIMGEGEWATAWGSFQHIVRKTGSLFESEWSVVCRINDGRILSYQIYEDTDALERAFGVR